MNHHQSRRNTGIKFGIITLALFFRYILPLAILILPSWLCPRSTAILLLGIGGLLYALYWFMGYRLKWRHFYCAYQNAYHRPMTPFNINWKTVKKREAYGVPVIFAVLGIAMIVIFILGI